MLVKMGSRGKWLQDSDGLGSLAGGMACRADENDKKRSICQQRPETISLQEGGRNLLPHGICQNMWK